MKNTSLAATVVAIVGALLALKRYSDVQTLKRRLARPSWQMNLLGTSRRLDTVRMEGYWAMNASYAVHKGVEWLLVRYVNYKLLDKSQRVQTGPGRTRYKLARLDRLRPVEWHDVTINTHLTEAPDRISYGIEDARIESWGDKMLLIGTTCSYNGRRLNDAIRGELNVDTRTVEHLQVLSSPTGKVEKNWVFLCRDKSIDIVYGYNPLRLYQEAMGQAKVVGPLVDGARPHFGSTNWARVEGGYITIVHSSTIFRGDKYYFHKLLMFDESLGQRRETDWFTFEGKLVEFTTGLCVQERTLHIWYSIFDRDTSMASILLDRIPWT